MESKEFRGYEDQEGVKRVLRSCCLYFVDKGQTQGQDNLLSIRFVLYPDFCSLPPTHEFYLFLRTLSMPHFTPCGKLNQCFWFFPQLVGRKGSRIRGFRDSRVCFLKILSMP